MIGALGLAAGVGSLTIALIERDFQSILLSVAVLALAWELAMTNDRARKLKDDPNA